MIKNDSNYLDVKLKVFNKGYHWDIQLEQNLYMGERDFNQCSQLREKMVIAAENFVRGENWFLVLLSTMSKNMEEQLKLAHKFVDVVDRANKKFCATLLRYIVDRLDSFYAQVQVFACKN